MEIKFEYHLLQILLGTLKLNMPKSFRVNGLTLSHKKKFFMLNSAEHGIFSANNNSGIFIFISTDIFMNSYV